MSYSISIHVQGGCEDESECSHGSSLCCIKVSVLYTCVFTTLMPIPDREEYLSEAEWPLGSHGTGIEKLF